MKKLILLTITIIQTSLFYSVEGQVLNVNNNEQLYDQWCWAGCSKTILDYYGFITPQCEIAEFTRTTATFHNFGNIDCCSDPTQGCNYWNYNYGNAGSIQNILIHFGNLQNVGIGNSLTLSEIITEIQNNRLFVIRWGWSTGGGHFVVGHGVNGNNIYFMNPWFGEGLHIGTYSNVVSGIDNTSTATHTWTHTNKITSNVTALNEQNKMEITQVTIYPNPFTAQATINFNEQQKNTSVKITDMLGKEIRSLNFSGKQLIIDREEMSNGIYFVLMKDENKNMVNKKIVIQ